MYHNKNRQTKIIGFPCWDTLQGDLRKCEYCGEDTDEPIHHYLLSCPSTDGLRVLLGAPEHLPPPERTRAAAAAIVRRLQQNNAALDVLRTIPPSR